MSRSDTQEQLEPPVVSMHNEPQPYPQEWECGCITAAYVTDRDFLRDERPFEMRLAYDCGHAGCELWAHTWARKHDKEKQR